MADALHWLPAWQLEEMVVKREISPVELTEYFLDRLDQLEPTLHSMITVAHDHAREAARAAEDKIMRDEELGPLHGLPLSIKDLVVTKDVRTTHASRLYEDWVPDQDSTVCARARAAGAILVGKTNTPEFGMYGRAINLVSEESVNPWDTTRTSGGSSGGSGVAVAAGLSPLSIGTDGGGSIRLPSSWNGIFGLHPSRGLVSHFPQRVWNPHQGIGPMTRDVRDAAMLLQVIAGHDAGDPLTVQFGQRDVPDYVGRLDDGVAGMRFAWSPDFGFVDPVDPRVVDTIAAAVPVFEEAGGIVEAPALRIEDVWDALRRFPEIHVEKSYEELDPLRPPELPSLMDFFMSLATDPEMRKKVSIYVLDRGEHPSQLEYTMSIPPWIRNMPVDSLESVFERYDLLLSPVITRIAPVCGEHWHVPWTYTSYTFIVNVSGYCAASVPCGFVDGMPVGMQIMGRPGDELRVLQAARAFELHRPWAHLTPPHAEVR
jgi:Asp-tRNA(Asn)/Glu-tRNA(Gln) amidotransferase A subunit family amidase